MGGGSDSGCATLTEFTTKPAGEEICRAKRRGADVEHEPFAGHPQIFALGGQDAALGEVNIGDVEAGNFARFQFVFDGFVKFLAGRGEAGNERIPMLHHLRFFRFKKSEHIFSYLPLRGRMNRAALKINERNLKQMDSAVFEQDSDNPSV